MHVAYTSWRWESHLNQIHRCRVREHTAHYRVYNYLQHIDDSMTMATLAARYQFIKFCPLNRKSLTGGKDDIDRNHRYHNRQSSESERWKLVGKPNKLKQDNYDYNITWHFLMLTQFSGNNPERRKKQIFSILILHYCLSRVGVLLLRL